MKTIPPTGKRPRAEAVACWPMSTASTACAAWLFVDGGPTEATRPVSQGPRAAHRQLAGWAQPTSAAHSQQANRAAGAHQGSPFAAADASCLLDGAKLLGFAAANARCVLDGSTPLGRATAAASCSLVDSKPPGLAANDASLLDGYKLVSRVAADPRESDPQREHAHALPRGAAEAAWRTMGSNPEIGRGPYPYGTEVIEFMAPSMLDHIFNKTVSMRAPDSSVWTTLAAAPTTASNDKRGSIEAMCSTKG